MRGNSQTLVLGKFGLHLRSVSELSVNTGIEDQKKVEEPSPM
jgi:hypothetical protein